MSRMQSRTAVILFAALFLIPLGLAYMVDEAEALPGTTVTGTIQDPEIFTDGEVYVKWNIYGGEDWYHAGTADDKGEFMVTLPVDVLHDDDVSGTKMWVMCKTKNHFRISGVIPVADKYASESGESEVDLGILDNFPGKYIETESITLNILVGYGNVGISDARVTIKSVGESGTGAIVFETTDESGRCKFDLKTGEYTILVEKGGFEDWVSVTPIVLEAEAQVQSKIDLVLSPVKTYWGFDLPHLFTVMGLSMALIITSLIVLYMLWIKRHPGLTKVIDDSPDFDDHDFED